MSKELLTPVLQAVLGDEAPTFVESLFDKGEGDVFKPKENAKALIESKVNEWRVASKVKSEEARENYYKKGQKDKAQGYEALLLESSGFQNTDKLKGADLVKALSGHLGTKTATEQFEAYKTQFAAQQQVNDKTTPEDIWKVATGLGDFEERSKKSDWFLRHQQQQQTALNEAKQAWQTEHEKTVEQLKAENTFKEVKLNLKYMLDKLPIAGRDVYTKVGMDMNVNGILSTLQKSYNFRDIGDGLWHITDKENKKVTIGEDGISPNLEQLLEHHIYTVFNKPTSPDKKGGGFNGQPTGNPSGSFDLSKYKSKKDIWQDKDLSQSEKALYAKEFSKLNK